MFNPFDQFDKPAPARQPLVINGPPRQAPPQTSAQARQDQTSADLNAFRLQQGQATAAADRAKAEADARKAAAEARNAEMQAGQGGITAEARGKLQAQLSGAQNLQRSIDEIEQRFKRDFSGTGLAGMKEYLPGQIRPKNQEFNDAGRSLIGNLAAAYGLTAQQQNTPTELEIRFGPFVPRASDRDEVIAAKIARLRAVAQQQAEQAAKQLGTAQPGAAAQQQRMAPAAGALPPGGAPPAGGNGGAPPPIDPSGTGYIGFQGAPDPYQSQISAIDPAADKEWMRRAAQYRPGQMDDQHLAAAFAKSYQELTGRPLLNADQVAAHYNKTGQLSGEVTYRPTGELKHQVDEDQRQQAIINRQDISAQRGQGGALETTDALVRAAANGLTWGGADKFSAAMGGGKYADNLAQNRAVNQYDSQHHLAAQIAGSALGMVGNEAGLARAAAGAGRAVPMLGRGLNAIPEAARPALKDIGYGATYGAVSGDGSLEDRALNAGKNALASGAGGIAGRSVGRGAGRVLTGARDEAVQMLNERGIPMTIGQIAGRGGFVGRTIKSAEDKLMSLPIIGDAIRQRRMEGVSAFNRQAFDQALEPIAANTQGQIGEQGVQAARQAVSGGYDKALQGVNVGFDPTFAKHMARIIGVGQRLHPEVAGDFERIVKDELAPVIARGNMSGEDYQALRQILRQERADWAGKPRGRQYGNVLKQLEVTLDSLVRRQVPGAVPALLNADRAHRLTKVVEGAVERGKNTSGEFTPAQLGQAAAQNGRRFGNIAATPDRPFFDLQRAGQDVLPSQIPNSGTFDRAAMGAMIPLALGGGAQMYGASPQDVAMMTALGLPFTKAGQATFQKILASRPDIVRRLGEQVIARQSLFGAPAAAAPLLLQGR
jgi:hypothetical protein